MIGAISVQTQPMLQPLCGLDEATWVVVQTVCRSRSSPAQFAWFHVISGVSDPLPWRHTSSCGRRACSVSSPWQTVKL